MNKSINEKIPKNKINKFKNAQKSYKEIMEEIKPFLRERKPRVTRTCGRWANYSLY